MGFIYKRGNKLWIGFFDHDGKKKLRATGLDVNQKKQARLILEQIEARIAAEKALNAKAPVTHFDSKTVTLDQYAAKWIDDRRNSGLVSVVDDESRLRLHVIPYMGGVALSAIKPRHIRDLVRKLRGGHLAPRTIRNVYGVMHTMLKDAVVDELIDSNPCVLKRGDLPKKVDKDPTWRTNAVFTRGEIEQLLTHPDIPEDRRTLYALLVLAGLRFGEAAALRWRHLDTSLKPLGRLVVAASYNTRKRTEKAVKTEQPRVVPVHPTLAKVLAAWKLGGWPAMMKRPPLVDDLIIPSRRGVNRSRHHSLTKFHGDLAQAGMRKRRQHDLRRTFISLARADGARKDVLERVTHGVRGDIVDIYTELPWELICHEVAKLQLELLTGQLVVLPIASSGDR